jgi:hypothetical protein
VRSSRRDLDQASDLPRARIDHDDAGRIADVRVDGTRRPVVQGPPRPSGKRDLADDRERCDVDDGRDALDAGRIAEIERIGMAVMDIKCNAIRPRPDCDLTQQHLVGGAVDGETRATAIRRQQEVALRVDQHPGHAGMSVERVEIPHCAAVENIDPVSSGMRDVHAACRRCDEDVRVIEAGFRAPRHLDKAEAAQRHFLPTFSLQYA